MFPILLLAAADGAGDGLAARVERNPQTAAAAEMFISACVEGKLLLPRHAGAPVARKELFRTRQSEDVPRAEYYKIRKPFDGWLAVIDWKPDSRNGWERSCTIGTDGHDLETAWKLVTKAVTGKHYVRHFRNSTGYGLDVPAQRFSLNIERYEMRMAIINEQTAARMAAQLREFRNRSAQPVADREPRPQ